MSSAAEWQARILDALARETMAIPGPAGETPLSNLANQLIAIRTSGVDTAPLFRGLSNTIHSLGEADPERWTNLCHLMQLLEVRDASVSSALYEEFTKGIPRNVRSRAVIVVTLAEIGRRWTPAELNKERDVREHYAIEWIDAWVKSGLIDDVKTEIGNLLTADAVTVTDLIRRMPAWYQRLGGKLLEILPQWLNVIPAAKQDLLKRWLHNRGLQLRWKPPLIGADAVELVKEATAQKAKPLNGQVHSQPPTNYGPEHN
jgi:hypothetical protein